MTQLKNRYAICECSDSGCPAHTGIPVCKNPGTVILYRVDMLDLTGTLFCEFCAADALDSGLFTEEMPEAVEEAPEYPVVWTPDGLNYTFGAGSDPIQSNLF